MPRIQTPLGLSNAATAQASAIQEGPFSDQTVWDQLKTVYDPEIPGNIRPYAHDARGVAVRAHLSCWAFWSRASVIHVQGTIS